MVNNIIGLDIYCTTVVTIYTQIGLVGVLGNAVVTLVFSIIVDCQRKKKTAFPWF